MKASNSDRTQGLQLIISNISQYNGSKIFHHEPKRADQHSDLHAMKPSELTPACPGNHIQPSGLQNPMPEIAAWPKQNFPRQQPNRP